MGATINNVQINNNNNRTTALEWTADEATVGGGGLELIHLFFVYAWNNSSVAGSSELLLLARAISTKISSAG